MPRKVLTRWLLITSAVPLLLLFSIVFLATRHKNTPLPIRLESLLILTNTPYAILSMPKIRPTYAFTKNSGLPNHIEQNYWKWSGTNRIVRTLPLNGMFWTETNGIAFAHIPLENESGQFQLEYFLSRRLWLAGKHIGPRFSHVHLQSPLIPSADLYLSALSTNASNRP